MNLLLYQMVVGVCVCVCVNECVTNAITVKEYTVAHHLLMIVGNESIMFFILANVAPVFFSTLSLWLWSMAHPCK